MNKLVEITQNDFGVILDLRYATNNNVCQQILYKKAQCFLHEEAATKLKKAVLIAKKINKKLKIFDCYRPALIQKFMFEQFPGQNGQDSIFSHPETGSVPHCRGIAIDLTLTNLDGQEVDMGSDFDDLTYLAHHDYDNISAQIKENRLQLLGIMTEAGFDFYDKEWWHYQLFKPRTYDIIQNHNDLSNINLK